MENFVDLVKDALEHLYDPAFLRDHPLARHLMPDRLPPGIGPAQALRQALLDGIEQLNFSASLPAGAKPKRAHQILVLRYVEVLPFREVMAELSLSQPQFHREQRHALETLAALLAEKIDIAQVKGVGLDSNAPHATPYADFDAAVQRHDAPIDLGEVIRGVVPMLIDVAGQVGVTLRWEALAPPAIAFANRTALRGLVIGMVGYVLCGASGGEVVLSTAVSAEIVIRAVLHGRVDQVTFGQPEADDRLAVVSRLVKALRGHLIVRKDVGLSIVARLPAARRTLLVIDDNADAVQLVERLLADQHYTTISAQNVRDGLDLAQTAHPDAILLDIMMPDQDGWEALQLLKHTPSTEDVPVIVCTILAEARLALALGAAEFIRKPLTRPLLLEALTRWTTSPRLPAEASQ